MSGTSATLALIVFGLLVIAVLLARLRRLRNDQQEARASVVVDGVTTPLPDVIWSVAANGGVELIGKTLHSSRATSADRLHAEVIQAMAALPDVQRQRLLESAALRARTRAERELYSQHTAAVAGAFASGSVDSLLLALGDNPDWLADAITSLDLPGLAAHSLVHNASGGVDALFPETSANVAGQIADGLGPGMDAASDGLISGLVAIADAHIPVITVGRSVFRAKRAADAGLEADRVIENFAWDAGGTGSGIIAGATLGSFVLPVVGTAIGGIVGGLAGGVLAEFGKHRHLVEAQARAQRALEMIGAQIGPAEWISIAKPLEERTRALETNLADLEAWARRPHPRLWRTSLGRAALAATAEVGADDLAVATQELDSWQQELSADAAPELAMQRGAVIVSRADLQTALALKDGSVPRALKAQRRVQEERRKLELA